jgi:hypothetical protein
MRKGDTVVDQSLSTSVGPSSLMCVARVKHHSIIQDTKYTAFMSDHNLVENMTFVNKN